jgi:hypothetical protein
MSRLMTLSRENATGVFYRHLYDKDIWYAAIRNLPNFYQMSTDDDLDNTIREILACHDWISP